MISNNIKFGQRDNDKNDDWAIAKSYLIDIHDLINKLEIQKGAITKVEIVATLEETGDVKILNSK